ITTESGRAEWRKRGLQCGAVLVNSKACFKIDNREVHFLRKPQKGRWSKGELLAVIANEVKRAYGKEAVTAPPVVRVSEGKGPKPLPMPKTSGDGLFMFCGAGLREPIEDVRKAFEKKYGIPVRVCYAGSACLLAQIAITQRGDLYLPGEEFYAKQAQERGFVEDYKIICYFIPVIMVQKGNPKRIHSLKDLARPGLRIGVGEPKACAIGKTTNELLRKHKLEKAVAKNIVMHAATAPELGNAIKLGSIDVAINWDAVAAWYEDAADIITIAPEDNIIVSCPLSILTFSKNKRMARAFLEFATGEDGQAIFRRHRYTTDLSKPIYPHRRK
ncbi:MAG TPA: molybdate ABC transporter substrate-binding protein, partial [Armatimonadetes bacterium]|nr:molybdate ABC transporter substrate-binding protein [Armatimonadota bacterium]